MQGSEELANAYDVASKAGDEDLWHVVARRAVARDALAEYNLREWPSTAGIAFFCGALSDTATGKATPLLENALFFFLLCMTDQGLGFLSSALGDPFVAPARGKVPRIARLSLGDALLNAEEFHDLKLDSRWASYIAASLIVDATKRTEREVWLASRAVLLLRRAKDPRTPVVMGRLIERDVFEPEDVFDALTCAPGDEARHIVDDLLLRFDQGRLKTRSERLKRELDRASRALA